ncbi:spondin domain-containing protein [Colwellia sp. TT2012]|uniref:spondin domain-containing protein n=1 Tax=Colwellia sp. TT2012 TaxID=1720342 RepID=UPI00070E6220|nr:spondin domain-containing protein [Colwellia sp. TT2012]
MLTFNAQKNISRKTAKNSLYQIVIVSLLTLGLAACGDSYKYSDDNYTPLVQPPMEYSYSITLTNLTYGQPLSPIAVILHGDSKMWQVGQSASVALEKLAEGGDNSDFLALESNLATTSSAGPVPPGASVTLNISTTEPMANYLTVVTMLVNTNDAFSGLTGVDISTLVLNQEKSWRLNVYDSGTEQNNEAVGTIPGPADGGVGFDADRNDIDLVGYHSGVVSKDDGLSSSVLTQAHRFDNPAVKLTITRTK